LKLALLLSLLAALSLGAPASAKASVERFAVLIGNDAGEPGEQPLRYAASDARRLYGVLRELGGFEPYNMLLLRDENAATVRSSLLSINERVREAVARPDTDVMLLVYYSGHADARDLHLGKSRLALRELVQMVRGSAAKFRLIVLDACRSGSLTRVKGGRVKDPFALPEERLPGDGLAYLTASSSSEDAQESDTLGASFFTHALVSGLLGAADDDGDGEVVLDEAYRYAYDATRRATSRTLAGTQHPAFRYDYRGSGRVVLTRPRAHDPSRARLRFPARIGFLVMADHAEGTVVGELSAGSRQRQLSLRPGRYFIRGRGSDVLYETTLNATAGRALEVDVTRMDRIEYARLVRKGQRRSGLAHGPELGVLARTALPNEADPCLGASLGYALQLEHFTTRLRAGGCRGGFENAVLTAQSSAIHLELQALRIWDPQAAPALSLELGLAAGGTFFTQRFDTAGQASTRHSLAPLTAIVAGLGLDLGAGYRFALQLGAETHFLRLQRQAWQAPSWQAGFALRGTAMLAKEL